MIKLTHKAKEYGNADRLAEDFLKEYFKEEPIKYPINPFQILKDMGVMFLLQRYRKLEGVYLPATGDDDYPMVGINADRPIRLVVGDESTTVVASGVVIRPTAVADDGIPIALAVLAPDALSAMITAYRPRTVAFVAKMLTVKQTPFVRVQHSPAFVADLVFVHVIVLRKVLFGLIPRRYYINKIIRFAGAK